MTTLPNVADLSDVTTGRQIFANSITLASAVSQLVILVTFLPDLSVFPTSLKALSTLTIVSSMLSALVVFVASNLSCNPAIQIGCTLYLIGNVGKWCTYSLRIWLLSYRRNLWVAILMGVSILLTASTFQWWCAVSTGVRGLPRLCAPVTNPRWAFTEWLSAGLGAFQNFIFIVLHVYYLWGYFRDIISSGRPQTKSMFVEQPNTFAASLALFASSILVMVVDLLQFVIRISVNDEPLRFFLIVWSAQIVSDLIYCSYMRRFANELRREPQKLHVAQIPLGLPTIAPTAVTNAPAGREYFSIEELRKSNTPSSSSLETAVRRYEEPRFP